MSRPEKQIDWLLVDKLLEGGCQGTEIAPHFDMHPDTFYRRIMEKYGVGFTDYCAEKRRKGESILRMTQYLKAIGETKKGDNTLLIWLGKQRLEQKETFQETQVSEDINDKYLALMNQLASLQSERKIAESNISNEQKS